MMYCVIYSFPSIPNLQWPPLYCPPDRTTFLILSFILTCVTILSTVLAYHISKVMNLRKLEGVDRISSLPDELLCHILSFLPTKLAVTTSILSTRWKHLPDFVPDIDLSYNNIGHSNAEHTVSSIKLRNDRFMHAVLKVLTVRTFPAILDIPKFSLSCFFLFDHHIFCQSIKLLVMRNVRKLNLSLLLEDSATLPDEILKCKSLEVLKLNCELCLNVPESVVLPNLKVIELYNLDFFGDSSIRKLLAGCPSLEDLWLSFCLFEEENVEISHPLLKHVTLTDLMGDYYLIFDTPNLRNLMCISDRDVVTVVKNMKSLVHAHICCGSVDTQLEQVEDEEWEDLQLESINGTNFINEMHEARFLYLEGSAINALFFSDCSFSTFQNLSLMELGSTHVSGWLVLPELLECTPNLKVLVFYEGFINWDSPTNEFEYCLPLSAPACFSRTLEEIKVGAFGGYECELELIEYFLKSVQGLKMMMIGAQVSSVSPFEYPRFYRPSEYLKKPEKWVVPTSERLSVVPRCSKACQIMLTWNEGSKIL